ncbi:uncharacterized protein LOC134281987 [Saccostrea cucullata]|uniref:uncharacterized protein LOC134281987 n=1 Tax=Saccostrea cuccullata TaxID=36930 RepID=UPI002ED08F08
MSSRFRSAQKAKPQSLTAKTEFDLPTKSISNTNQQKRIRPKTVPTRPQKDSVKPISLSVTAKPKTVSSGQVNSEKKGNRNENGATKHKSLSNSLTKETENGSKNYEGEKSEADVNTTTLSSPEPNVTWKNDSEKEADLKTRTLNPPEPNVGGKNSNEKETDVNTGTLRQPEPNFGRKNEKGKKPRASLNTGTLSQPKSNADRTIGQGEKPKTDLNIELSQAEQNVNIRISSSSNEISDNDSVAETQNGNDNTPEHIRPESSDNDLNNVCNGQIITVENGNANGEDISEEQLEASVFDGVGRFFMCSIDSDVTTPWVGGLAYVKSGDVICLDLNNECIKRFDKNFKIVASIEVPFDCCGMTITSHDEIAVTCLNEIHFYNVGKFGMNRTAKYVTVNGMAHGIASDQSWFAVTCDISEPEESTIRIIDENGREQLAIYPPVVSELPLKLSSSIEFDKSVGRVFISESAPSRVVCVNFQGEALWDTSIPGGSRGIVSIGNNILVCDQFSEKVRLLTKDGALKAAVLSSEDGLCNPDIIARRPDSNDVIVSYGGFGTIGLFSIQ